MQRVFFVFALVTIAALIPALRPTTAQAPTPPADLRLLHERAVYATVQIETSQSLGTGWLLAQSGRPMVVTNRHVVEGIADARVQVSFYQGGSAVPVTVPAVTVHRSDRIDMAYLRLLADPPESARPLQMRVNTQVVRGERVVLGGNPVVYNGVLPFQTTEGTVTGHVSGPQFSQCGIGRNCIVLDAASLGGSSGGPAFNREGQLVGMLWGGPALVGTAVTGVSGVTNTGRPVTGAAVSRVAVQNPAFSYLIHARTLAAVLRAREQGRVRRR